MLEVIIAILIILSILFSILYTQSYEYISSNYKTLNTIYFANMMLLLIIFILWSIHLFRKKSRTLLIILIFLVYGSLFMALYEIDHQIIGKKNRKKLNVVYVVFFVQIFMLLLFIYNHYKLTEYFFYFMPNLARSHKKLSLKRRKTMKYSKSEQEKKETQFKFSSAPLSRSSGTNIVIKPSPEGSSPHYNIEEYPAITSPIQSTGSSGSTDDLNKSIISSSILENLPETTFLPPTGIFVPELETPGYLSSPYKTPKKYRKIRKRRPM